MMSAEVMMAEHTLAGLLQGFDGVNVRHDLVVSGLVLNFVPDRNLALAEMKRVVRLGGTVAYYVWDYAGGGLEFLHAFWTAASEIDKRRPISA